MKDQTVYQFKQENTRNSDGKYLGPHLLDIFKNHVAMSIKGSHTAEKLPVITTIDEDLRAQWEHNWIRNLVLDKRRHNKN